MARCRTPADGEDDRLIHERASLRQRHIMQDMTTRIVPIEPQWFMQKAEVQSRTWRELNQGHIPQDIVDAITPAFALKLTRGHAADPNQVVLIALADDRVVGFTERTTPSVSGNGMAACSSASCGTWALAALMFLSIICAASRCASGESDVTPVSNNRLHCSASASMESCDCLSRLSRIRESRLRSSASSRAHRSAAATLPTGRSLRGVNRKTRHATSRKILPFSPDPGREHRTNIIPLPA